MREASERLAEAETAASEHQRRAQRDPNAYHSAIYPVGSEYALCYAESQLMSAVVAVLNESLTESIKGFYRLRKAYATLQEIADAEKAYLNRQGRASTSIPSRQSSGSQRSARSLRGPARQSTSSSATKSKPEPTPATATGDNVVAVNGEDDFDFVDADETHSGIPTPVHYEGHLASEDPLSKLDGLSLNNKQKATDLPESEPHNTYDTTLEEDQDFENFTNHPIDTFIHSGTNMCFGILQLLLSLIPPAFSKLLYIIGFKGDRDAGLAMLWRATRYDNINGAIAGLVVLGFYNVSVGFCEIVTKDAYPKERCRRLLASMREKYPKSRLWILEEARMKAGDKDLEKAVEMTGTKERSPLKQVEALQWFECSLCNMYLHRYEACADGFMKCVELNNWSHGLYYYIAGACHVELYRQHKGSDPVKAEKHAARAKELLGQVTSKAGKKRFMARQLPFDVYVTRKIAKWEERAKQWGVDFVDAVGVAPIEEMIWFWNGYKRMRPEHLNDSLKALAWSEDEKANPTWSREGLDEKAILSVLRASTITRLGRTDEAKRILESEVLCHPWASFKGHLKDTWPLPLAHYEMAVNLWVECKGEDSSLAQMKECSKKVEECQKKLLECFKWTEKTAAWEGYDLDAR